MTAPARPQGPAKVVWFFGLAIIVAVLIFIAWSSMSLVSRELASSREAHAQVLGTREVLTDLQTLLVLLRDAETGERGYIITNDARFLESYETARLSLDEHLHAIESALGGVGSQETLDRLMVRSREHIEYLNQVIELQRRGDTRQAVEIINSRVGKQRMDEIRGLVAALEEEQRQKLTQRAQAFNERSVESESLVKGALVAAVLLVLSASALLFRYAHRRLLAEGAAAQASQLLRSTMDNITEGLVVYDQYMHVLSWNPRFLELRRLEPGQIRVGMTAAELMQLAEPLNVTIAGTIHDTRRSTPGFGDLTEPFQGEGTTPSGLVLRIWGSPIANGNYIVTISDVTALRNSEAAYRDRAARLNSTLDNVVDAIITINESGSIESWSKSAERLFGYTTEEVLHRNVKHLMPEQPAVVLDSYLRNPASTGEQRGQRRQVEALHKDGHRIPVDLGVSEMYIGSRRLYVAIVRDISERLEIDRMKSGFVSTVSHELRTPLTSIGGSLGLLAGGAAGPLAPKAAKLIDIAKQNCDRLVRLINDILDLEKAESGKLQLRLEEQALAPIVEQAIELNRGYADSFGVSIKLEPHDIERKVRVDHDRFIQVLTNLLSNAVKYSPRGGVVSVRVTAGDNTVTVSVLDEGSGIPREFENRIFQKFSQADSSDTRAKGGTGLGLSIARTLMERFHGNIDFERGRSKGAHFHVTLPSRQPSAGTLTLPILSVQAPHILICEDDPDMTEYLSAMLNGAGMTVGTAETAGAARAAMGEERFDLLLIDIHLPDADGLDVVKELRGDQTRQALPVIVMTGSASSSRGSDDVQALRLADWLQKPVRPERLVGAIRTALLGHERDRLRVLHVEDDQSLTELVQTLLEGPANVVAEHSVGGARARLAQETFDMVILDVMLGDGSGLDLLPLLQQGANPPPVVLYTAIEPSREVADKVERVIVKSRHSVTDLLASVRGASAARSRRNITAA